MSYFEPSETGQLTTAEIAWLSAAVAAGLPGAGNALEVFRVNAGGTGFEFASGAGFTVLTTVSAVNGGNSSFVFSNAVRQPSLIVVDGAQLTAVDNNGKTQWTWDPLTLTVTLFTPPPTNSIFGIQ